MTANPILYILGIEGHIYTARALTEEFKCPVVGVITTQRMQELFTEEDKKVFSKLYSFPNFYFENINTIKRLTIQELNEEQKELEQELGIKNSALLTYYDRRLRTMGDSRKVREWQLCTLRFLKVVLSEISPIFCLDGVVTYMQNALRDICTDRDIPYMLSLADRDNGYAFYHTNGHHIGMQATYNELQKGNQDIVDPEVMQKADEVFYSYIENPFPPAYAVKNSLIGFQWNKFWPKVKMALDPQRLFPSEQVVKLDREMNNESSPVDTLGRYIRSKYRNIIQGRLDLFDKSPDMNVPFFYAPLHYTPENTDLYFGSTYDHHEGYITNLAKQIPSDAVLYVKEHTSMLGRRPTYFYQNLRKLYNVKLIHPKVSTFSLIKNSLATITVAGTAGWEAYLLGRPAVAFGNVMYNFLPNVLHCPLDGDFILKLKKYLQEFSPSETERRDAFRAYYATRFDGSKVDIGYTASHTNAENKASGYSQNMHKVIQKWHQEIHGHFPDYVLKENNEQ